MGEEVSAVARAKQAIEAGDLASLENQLKQKEVRPDERIGSEEFTLVHWACYFGKFEVRADTVFAIVDASINMPLCIIQMQVLQRLLFQGGNVDLVENHGWTPAHVCAIRGENSCLQVYYIRNSIIMNIIINILVINILARARPSPRASARVRTYSSNSCGIPVELWFNLEPRFYLGIGLKISKRRIDGKYWVIT